MTMGYKVTSAQRERIAEAVALGDPDWKIARATGLCRRTIEVIRRDAHIAGQVLTPAVADVDARERTEGYPW